MTTNQFLQTNRVPKKYDEDTLADLFFDSPEPADWCHAFEKQWREPLQDIASGNQGRVYGIADINIRDYETSIAVSTFDDRISALEALSNEKANVEDVERMYHELFNMISQINSRLYELEAQIYEISKPKC